MFFEDHFIQRALVAYCKGLQWLQNVITMKLCSDTQKHLYGHGSRRL